MQSQSDDHTRRHTPGPWHWWQDASSRHPPGPRPSPIPCAPGADSPDTRHPRASPSPATVSAEGRLIKGGPFPTSVTAEGRQFNGAPSLPRLFLDDQTRIASRNGPPNLHPSSLFLQEADYRGGVITPTAVHGLDQLLLGESRQRHRDLEFPCQLRSQPDILAHQFGRKETLVPIRLKVATGPAFRQTMNAASAMGRE